MAEKKELKKQKRIKGRKYWELQGKLEELEKFQKALAEWEGDEAERMELYPDQINWNVGSIFEDNVEIVNGRVINGKVKGRIPLPVFKQRQVKLKEVKKLNVDIIKFQDELAQKLGIWPDMINIQTGIIVTKEYEGVDPDQQTITKKKTAKKKKEK